MSATRGCFHLWAENSPDPPAQGLHGGGQPWAPLAPLSSWFPRRHPSPGPSSPCLGPWPPPSNPEGWLTSPLWRLPSSLPRLCQNGFSERFPVGTGTENPVHPLPPHTASPLMAPALGRTSVTLDGPTRARHHHPQSTVCIRLLGAVRPVVWDTCERPPVPPCSHTQSFHCPEALRALCQGIPLPPQPPGTTALSLSLQLCLFRSVTGMESLASGLSRLAAFP